MVEYNEGGVRSLTSRYRASKLRRAISGYSTRRKKLREMRIRNTEIFGVFGQTTTTLWTERGITRKIYITFVVGLRQNWSWSYGDETWDGTRT